MRILSRYSVLEYLLWVKNNHYLVDNRNNEFCVLLNNNYKTLQVFQHESPSRNIVFRFQLGVKSYIFKQYGPDLVKREKYFHSEVFALNTNIEQLPKLVYQDQLANIIITEELVAYKDFTTSLKELIKKFPKYDNLIVEIIENVADTLKLVHDEVKFSFSQNPSLKDIEAAWFEFLKDKPTLWRSELAEQFIGYRISNYAHYIHYDLKGKNILINTVDFEVRILDWEMSEKGDPYYDLCFIIFEICAVFISPDFLYVEINNSSIMDYAKKYIDTFIYAYNTEIDRRKLNIFFKIIFYEFKKNDLYLDNIDLFLPSS
jgi:thiamine kinase-like enzyme